MNKKGLYRILAVSLAAVTILSSLGGLPGLALAEQAETVQESVSEETETAEAPTEKETIIIAPEIQEQTRKQKKETGEEAETKAASHAETAEWTAAVSEETAQPKPEENHDNTTKPEALKEEEDRKETEKETENRVEKNLDTEKETRAEESPEMERESRGEDNPETEKEKETEAAFRFPEVKDTSVLKGLDFSSKRLIVISDKDIIVDPEHLLSSYDGISLLQYETEKEAKKAYAYYLGKADIVDVDIVFHASQGTSAGADSVQMTEESNPVAMLESISEDSGKTKMTGAVAMIDSGVSKSAGVMERVSVLDTDPGDDFGHGNKMAAYMRETNPDVRILSIKALDENGNGTASSIYSAIEYAISRKVKVINLSLSAYSKADNACIRDAIKEAVSQGIMVTGSAGNKAANVKYYIPGNIDEAIIAGACDERGHRLSSSNYGDTIDYLVKADTTSEASARLAAWLAAHADARTYAADIDTVIDRGGLIFTADAEGQGLEPEAGDGIFSADASVKVTSSEYLRKIYYNHIGAAFKVSYKGTTYQGVCGHDLIPAIPSKGSNLTIDYHKTITLKDKGSWFYTYAKIVYNAYYKESQYEKLFDKYPTHRRNSDLTKKDSRIYYTGLAMSYAQGHVYKNKSSIKNMIYNSSYGYDIGGDGAGLGKKVYNWVKNNGIDLAPNITIDIIWAYPSSHSRQPVIAFDVIKTPVASLQKTSVSEEGTAMSVVPSGAVYTIYSDQDCKTEVVTLKVGDDGNSDKIPGAYFSAGKTYYAKETKGPTADPPEGYKWVMDTEVHSFSWDMKDDLVLKYTNTLEELPPPPPDEATVGIRKVTRSGYEDMVKGNSQYSLAGAVYGVWTNASCSGEPAGKATTSASGLAAFGKYFPIGTTVFIREISPSHGYEINPAIYPVTVSDEPANNLVKNRVTCEETPASGTLQLKKKSMAESDPNTNFDGAIFRISYYPNASWSGTATKNWYFITKGNEIRYENQYLAPGYTSDALFTDASGKAALPAGTLTVTELKAPEGYVVYSGALKCAMEFNESSGKVLPKWTGSSYLEAGSVYSFKNLPAFGGIQFSKIDVKTREPLQGAVIAIYNCSGKPVLVNEGGSYKTVADKALVTTVTTDAKGIAKTVANMLGTGKYYAVEQTPPFGYIRNTSWKKEFTITSADNGRLIDATDVTLENTAITIHTEASSEELDEASLYEESEDGKRSFKDIRITDTLSYENLPEGYYLVRGILMDKKTGKAFSTPDGRSFTAYSVLEVKKAKGTAQVTFVITGEHLAAFDKKDGTNSLEGASLVVFERLYSLNKDETDEASEKPEDYASEKRLIAVHEDIHDAAQDIRFPSLQTHANDGADEAKADQDHGISELGRHEVLASDQMVITDRVTYKNLHGDTEYVITGTLHYTDGSVVKDDTGKEVTASETIHTSGKYEDSVSGYADLTFGPFSGLNLAGKTIVAFETASREGKAIMVHADISDAPQTFYIPAIHTSASGFGTTADMHEAKADKDSGINDVVAYENLKPGQAYILRGRLVYQADYPEDGIKAGDPVIIDGKELTAERAFTADGKVEEPQAETEDITPVQPDPGSPADPGSEPESESEGETAEAEETEDFSDLSETDESELYDDGDTDDVEDLNDYSGLEDEEDPGEDESVAETENGDEPGSGSQETGTPDQNESDNTETPDPQVQVTDEGIDVEQAVKELSRSGRYDGVSGSIVLSFPFDVAQLQGKTVVVFEKLYADSEQTAEEGQPGNESEENPETGDTPGTDIPSTQKDDSSVKEKLVAVHEDITDKDQTVNIPQLGTSLRDGVSNTQESDAGKTTVLHDTVSFVGLQIGKTYLLSGTLMNKKTGEPLLAGGSIVTAQKEFSYEDLKGQKDIVLSEDGHYFSGTVSMTFSFDSSALAGITVVAFEKLYRDNIPVGAHEDITDKDQSLDIVKIRTRAANKETGTQEAQASEKTVITDSVWVTNLHIGEKYRLESDIMAREYPGKNNAGSGDRETEEGGSMIPDSSESVESESEGDELNKTAEGEPVEIVSKAASLDFSYEDLKDDERTVLYEDGEHYDAVVEIQIPADTAAHAGKTLVIFEKLYHDNTRIASHEEIMDDEQSIDIIDLHTTAADKVSGTHEGQAAEKALVTDQVKIEHLLIGRQYQVKGTLMNKKTGKSLLVNGKEVSAERTFSYEDLKEDKRTVVSEDGRHFSGAINLEFSLDSSALAGTTVVAFEKLYHDDIEIAVHEEINDEDQSVHIVDIHTLAVDEKSGSQTMTLADKATLTDTVYYTGLTAGKKYTIQGTVMDKQTKKEVKTTSDPVSFTVKKTGVKAGDPVNGKVKMSFKLNTNELQGRELVVFETLLDADGNVIARHEDIEDKKQTVTVPEKQPQTETETKSPDNPETPDKTTPTTAKNQTEKKTPAQTRPAVKTGAIFHALLWFSLFAASGLTIVSILFRRRRRKH